MSGPQPRLVGSWFHSYEEDTASAENTASEENAASTSVYRPDVYPFPLSRRPRSGLEFRPDGTFVERQPGPDDRLQETDGHWEMHGPDRVRITYSKGHHPPLELTIISCTDEVLVVARN